ncbi:hypothetical protein IQ07DRAFT_29724 [Pyrenochaeta sp. DS3sAY3a]|nr:hypothetical protein IQ07DRAFT_29724 [Pyrenochaeta sp. DS3sAY3a]
MLGGCRIQMAVKRGDSSNALYCPMPSRRTDCGVSQTVSLRAVLQNAHVDSRHAMSLWCIAVQSCYLAAGRSAPSHDWASAARWVALPRYGGLNRASRLVAAGSQPGARLCAATCDQTPKVLCNHAAVQKCPLGLQRPTRRRPLLQMGALQASP